MSDDLFPSNDADFDKVQKQFIATVSPSPATYGLVAADVTKLSADQAQWDIDYPAQTKATIAAHTATVTKDATRAALETDLRGAAKKLNGTAGVTNAMRLSVGLAAHADVRSHIGPPETQPLGRIELGGHFTLILHFVDSATPKRTAKPHGVHGCQIWFHVGDPAPADATGYTFLALDTRTPYTDVHPAADAGKSVYYMLRWANTKGEPGPWSDVLTAKIPV